MDAALEIPLVQPETPKKRSFTFEYLYIGFHYTIIVCIVVGAIVAAVLLL